MAARDRIANWYLEYLGREITEDEYNYWVGLSNEEARIGIASSAESINFGTDLGAAGVEVVDPNTLNSAEREVYDVYIRNGVDPSRIFQHELNNWVQHGSAAGLDANLQGAIIYRHNDDGSRTEIYTERAVEIMGDEIHNLSGASAGHRFAIHNSANAQLGGDQWESAGTDGDYSIFMSQGNPTGGWLEDLGIEKYFPEEGFLFVDMNTLGLGAAILGGEKGVRESQKALGKDLVPAATALNAVASAAIVAYSGGTAAPLVAGGLAAAKQYGNHQTGGDFDIGAVLTEAGLAYAGAKVGGTSGEQMLGRAALSGARTSLTGGDTEDVLISVGASALGQSLNTSVGGKMGKTLELFANAGGNYAKNNNLTSALIGAGVSAVSAAIRTNKATRPIENKDTGKTYDPNRTLTPVRAPQREGFKAAMADIVSGFNPANSSNWLNAATLNDIQGIANKVTGSPAGAPASRPSRTDEDYYTQTALKESGMSSFLNSAGAAFFAAGMVSLQEDKRKAQKDLFRKREKAEEERQQKRSTAIASRRKQQAAPVRGSGVRRSSPSFTPGGALRRAGVTEFTV